MTPAEALARNLSALRSTKGWSQEQLAETVGLPRSTIATLEGGGANPTLAVLSSLSTSLQWSIEELISHSAPEVTLHPPEARPKPRRSRGAEIGSLLPSRLPGVEFERLTLEPGASLRGTPHRQGTKEFIYCAQGELELHVDGEARSVPEGTTASFRGEAKHSYRNDSARTAVAYSVVFVPRGATN